MCQLDTALLYIPALMMISMLHVAVLATVDYHFVIRRSFSKGLVTPDGFDGTDLGNKKYFLGTVTQQTKCLSDLA